MDSTIIWGFHVPLSRVVIHLLLQYTLGAYYVLHTILVPGNTAGNRADQISAKSYTVYVLVRGDGQKHVYDVVCHKPFFREQHGMQIRKIVVTVLNRMLDWMWCVSERAVQVWGWKIGRIKKRKTGRMQLPLSEMEKTGARSRSREDREFNLGSVKCELLVKH